MANISWSSTTALPIRNSSSHRGTEIWIADADTRPNTTHWFSDASNVTEHAATEVPKFLNMLNSSAAFDEDVSIFDDVTSLANASASAATNISAAKWGLTLTLAVTAIVTFLGNVLVIVSFLADKRLHSTFNLFVVNLAITDVLVAAMPIPFYATDYFLGYWPFNEWVCGLWIFLDWGMTFESIYILCAISLHRLWAVRWSLHYKTHNSNTTNAAAIVLVWLLLFLMWGPAFVLDRIRWSEPGTCIWSVANNRDYGIAVAVLGYHGPTLVMLYCYVMILYSIKTSKFKMGFKSTSKHPALESSIIHTSSTMISTVASGVRNGMSSPMRCSSVSDLNAGPAINHEDLDLKVVSNGQHTEAIKHDKVNNQQKQTNLSDVKRSSANRMKDGASLDQDTRVFIGLTYLIFAYIICWTPFHIVFDLLIIDPDSVSVDVYTFASLTCYWNSTLNPFIYAFTNRDFRRAFKKVLTCGRCVS